MPRNDIDLLFVPNTTATHTQTSTQNVHRSKCVIECRKLSNDKHIFKVLKDERWPFCYVYVCSQANLNLKAFVST